MAWLAKGLAILDVKQFPLRNILPWGYLMERLYMIDVAPRAAAMGA